MNKKIASRAQRHFATGVSLITSSGPHGQNVMAVEWTMQISYDPMLFAIFIHKNTASYENIRKTKEFGINVSSEDQATQVNIAGGYSGKEIDKLKIKNSFRIIPSHKIKAPMIIGCTVNVECKLVTMKKLGDHVMIIGKAVEISYDESKKPLIYHSGKYLRTGSIIESFRKTANVDKKTFDWFYCQSGGKFVLKCVGLIIKLNNKILVFKHNSKNNSYITIPYFVPPRGKNYIEAIENYLKKADLDVAINKIPSLKRLSLVHKKKVQRINLILFEGNLKSNIKNCVWKSKRSDSLLRVLED